MHGRYPVHEDSSNVMPHKSAPEHYWAARSVISYTYMHRGVSPDAQSHVSHRIARLFVTTPPISLFKYHCFAESDEDSSCLVFTQTSTPRTISSHIHCSHIMIWFPTQTQGLPIYPQANRPGHHHPTHLSSYAPRLYSPLSLHALPAAPAYPSTAPRTLSPVAVHFSPA